MGTPDTYDICGVCGETIIQVNNTGSWLHVETSNRDPRSTDCKSPFVRQTVASTQGQTTATHGRAKKRGT